MIARFQFSRSTILTWLLIKLHLAIRAGISQLISSQVVELPSLLGHEALTKLLK